MLKITDENCPIDYLKLVAKAYSEPCQISKMQRFANIVTAKSRELLSQNVSS